MTISYPTLYLGLLLIGCLRLEEVKICAVGLVQTCL